MGGNSTRVYSRGTVAVPSIHELRTQAVRQGVEPTDEDLERVQAFLAVVLPAFEELERLVPPETVPAGLFLPLPPA
jgi:hypothetical protein